TVYDMLFVAAAMQQGARLLTLDKKLKAIATRLDSSLVVDVK
ncbi:MAG: type II toxin-antitoxin system VapC family toxin, partial [Brachymonas sp.]|nr:type II toxin-antitoxin system VapC family toxin [Brachymonas sp.]